MLSLTEILSLVATVGSAVAGGYAARAAFLSAGSARKAQDAADAAERRASLRELANAAGGVLVEEKRIYALANEVKRAYRASATLSGASGGSRLNHYLEAADEKLAGARALADDAKLFADGARNLEQSPPEEIDRVLLRQTNALRKVQTLRDDLEREHLSLEAQHTQLLESMDRQKFAK